jgi:hypothetical protein
LEADVEDLEIGFAEVSKGDEIYQQKTSSTSEVATLVDDDDKTLASALAVMEDGKRSMRKEKMPYIKEENIPPEEMERATRSREFEHSIEDPIDLDMFRDNVITIQLVDVNSIPENKLTPREQEEAGKKKGTSINE